MPLTKTIVAVCGGGTRQMWAVEALRCVQQEAGVEIVKQPDIMMLGVSSGGITVGSLAVGRTLDEVANLLKTYSPEIFKTQRYRAFKSLLNVSEGVFDAATLYKGLRKEIGDVKIGDISGPEFAIIGYGTKSIRPKIFSNYAARNGEESSGVYGLKYYKGNPRLVDAIMASSALPVAFPSHVIKADDEDSRFLDGGLYTPNPAAIGVTECLRLYPKVETINLVVIGTGRDHDFGPDGEKLPKTLHGTLASTMGATIHSSTLMPLDILYGLQNHLKFKLNIVHIDFPIHLLPENMQVPSTSPSDASARTIELRQQAGEYLLKEQRDRIKEAAAMIKPQPPQKIRQLLRHLLH